MDYAWQAHAPHAMGRVLEESKLYGVLARRYTFWNAAWDARLQKLCVTDQQFCWETIGKR